MNRSGEDINVAQVVDAVNESMDVTRCEGKGNCQRGEACLTHHLWNDLSEQIHSFLESITLQSLVDRQEIQIIAKRQDSYQQGSQTDQDLTNNRISVIDDLVL